MNLVPDKINEFIKRFEELDVLLKENTKEMSQIDTDLSNLYHKIEGVTIKHVSESHALIKDLKSILNQRRDIKLNFMLLSSICDSLRVQMEKLKKGQIEKLEKHNKLLHDLSINSKNI